MAVIAALFAYLEYKNGDKALEKLALTVKDHDRDLAEIKDRMSSIKIAQQVKPGSISFR